MSSAAPRASTSSRAAWFVFTWALATGVLAKLARAVDLLYEGDSLAGFSWLPLGVCGEVLFAALPALLVAALARRVPVWAALVPGVAVVVGGAVWQAMNLTSFIVTQTGITLQRLRGDEGVTMADLHLMAFGDVVPAIAYGSLALLAVGPCVLLAQRTATRGLLGAKRALAAALSIGGYSVDSAVYRDNNFGVCEQPVFAFAASVVRAVRERDDDDDANDAASFAGTPLPIPKDRAGVDALLASTRQVPPPPPRAVDDSGAPRTASNAIVFFSEGIPLKRTALGGADTTPNLARRLAQGGLVLDRHYATYHKSIAEIFSLACADYPPPSSKSITEINPRIDCGELSEVLSASGLHVGLFHGGDFGFYDKLALLGMRGYEQQRDRTSLRKQPRLVDDGDAKRGTTGWWENAWGIDDRATVDGTLAWIDSLPKGEDGAPQRFVAWIIPITAHYPHDHPPDVPSTHPGFSGRDRFDSSVDFLDVAFERLMRGLEERGLLDDTVVVYTADHGETIGEAPRAQAGRRLMYEPSLRVPMALLSPTLFAAPGAPATAHSDRLTSHIDVLPTLLDLLGLPADPRHRGTSVFSATTAAHKVLVGASNGPRYLGVIDGDDKLLYNRTSGARELYHLDVDPGEQRNAIDELPQQEADRRIAELIAAADGQERLLKQARRLADIDVQQVVYDDADVALVPLRRDAGTDDDAGVASAAPIGAEVPCPLTRRGRERAAHLCATDPPSSTIVPAPALVRTKGGARRKCVVVAPPDTETRVVLTLRDSRVFSFLSRLRVTPLADASPAVWRVAAVVDGVTTARGVSNKIADLRVRHATPVHELRVEVDQLSGAPQGLCVTFTDQAWRP